ncbi:MAG: hypothetical protein CMM76_13590 [Rhodospirillaceae bacterium]|nr:hypothetical protein [Rhodospirillaceae bacterium]|tara:strand:+ start:1786 stop:2832 length:1047 start_codon:yes stop_codon:yes gene_type:complete
MNVKKYFRGNHRYDPIRCWYESFLNHNSDSLDFDVWLGNGWWDGKDGLHVWNSDNDLDPERYNILIDFESRNNHKDWEHLFDRVLTLDADVVEWRNNLLGEEKYVYVYTPTSDHWFNQDHDKKPRDVVICGRIADRYLMENMLKPLVSFDHMWVGRGKGDIPKEIVCEMKGGGYQEKMEIISRSKVMICWNAVPFTWNAADQMMNRPSMLNNPTNRHLHFIKGSKGSWPPEFVDLMKDSANEWKKYATNTKYLKPQLKTRSFEAAANKSLMLVCYDEFRHIETWFTEGEDFIYFQPGELECTLREVLQNFKNYEHIVASAYNKTSSLYKTSNFWNDFVETQKPKVVNK